MNKGFAFLKYLDDEHSIDPSEFLNWYFEYIPRTYAKLCGVYKYRLNYDDEERIKSGIKS